VDVLGDHISYEVSAFRKSNNQSTVAIASALLFAFGSPTPARANPLLLVGAAGA
jgi:hypothetical protein